MGDHRMKQNKKPEHLIYVLPRCTSGSIQSTHTAPHCHLDNSMKQPHSAERPKLTPGSSAPTKRPQQHPFTQDHRCDRSKTGEVACLGCRWYSVDEH